MFQIVPHDATMATKEPPTDDAVLDSLVANNGIYMRVAVKLGVTEEYVVQVITRNAAKLSKSLRAAMMVKSFAAVSKISDALIAGADEMSADTLGRMYGASVASFASLAQQFDEGEQADTDDDAAVAKEWMLERLSTIEERESEHVADIASEAG